MANRAWLYCRISGGHEHEEQKLLDNQEQRLLDYCAQRGLQVVGCTKVSDSGSDDLEKLTSQGIEQDDFDFLVTVSASRLMLDRGMDFDAFRQWAAAKKLDLSQNDTYVQLEAHWAGMQESGQAPEEQQDMGMQMS